MPCTECNYAESFFILSIVMASIIMLSVVMLSVIIDCRYAE